MSKQQAKAQINTTAKKKALVIAIIALVTVAIIVTTLIIALAEPVIKTLAPNDTTTLPSSDEVISNGGFEYLTEDTGVSYPMDAQDWDKVAYKAPNGSSHGYTDINSSAKSVMGVVDTDNWEDMTSHGLALQNPNAPQDDAKNSNIYMIHNKVPYTASIYSDSFSIPAGASVQITLQLKTVDIQGDSGAFMMVKQSSTSALEESTSGIQYWYAHQGVTNAPITGTNDWTEYELYVFNRTASSKTVYMNVGLGNVYTNDTAEGTLYIDDIQYATVTNNEYRLAHDSSETTSYVINSDKEDAIQTAHALTTANATTTVETTTTGEYLTANTYSPFLSDTDTIYSITNNGTNDKSVAMQSTTPLSVAKPITGTHYKISLWIRVIAPNDSVLPEANIYLYEAGTDNELASFTNIKTSTDIENDTNNGWAQYHFYIKPSNEDKDIELKLTFGKLGGYVNTDAIPEGTLLATQPMVEELTTSQYSEASGNDKVAKIALLDGVSTTVVNNGSFSSIPNNTPTTATQYYPVNWTGAYAGSIEIFKNGKDNITVEDKAGTVDSGIILDSPLAPPIDDNAKGILKITNTTATSYGYISGDITLSANTAYAISVLARNDGGMPTMNLLYNDIEDANNARKALTLNATTDTTLADSNDFNLPANTGDWTRYYFVFVTGDTQQTVNLALWNGNIDANETAGTSAGTVYFDQAIVTTLGTYTRDNDLDEIYTEDPDNAGEWLLDQDKADEITYNATAGYTDTDELLTKWNTAPANLTVLDYSTSDIDLPEVEEEEEEQTPPPVDPEPVNVGMLISIISSALLVGALLVVIVVKFAFKKKSNNN